MDEKLWGEKEDVERKEEAMPGDVVGKEVRLFLRVKRKARVDLTANLPIQSDTCKNRRSKSFGIFGKRISISLSTSHA